MALHWAPVLTHRFHLQAIGNTLLCSGEDRDFGGARYFFFIVVTKNVVREERKLQMEQKFLL